MFEVQHDLPFATLRIAINGTTSPVSVDETNKSAPALPNGMRIDGCQIGTLTVELVAGELVSILLIAEPLADWVASVESGESLDAFVFTHSSGAVGAVAMRDADWLCQRYRLEQTEGVHSIADAKRFSATYRATAPTLINIQVAYAWLLKPETAQEALSPWFAVDNALFS
jgi:hypothetical protein